MGYTPLSFEIEEIAKGSFKTKNPPEIQTSGYVVHLLESVLWAFYHTNTFAEGCLKIVNLGGDADTTGAIYGQIAGAYYGDSIPQNWRDKIFFRELILAMAGEITKLSSQVTSEKGTSLSDLPSKEYRTMWESFVQMEALHGRVLKRVLPGPSAYKSVEDFDNELAKLKEEYFSAEPQGPWKTYFWDELVRIASQEKEQVRQRSTRKPMILPFGKK